MLNVACSIHMHIGNPGVESPFDLYFSEIKANLDKCKNVWHMREELCLQALFDAGIHEPKTALSAGLNFRYEDQENFITAVRVSLN